MRIASGKAVLSAKAKPQIAPARYPGSEVRSHGSPWQAGSQKRRVESCGIPLKPTAGLNGAPSLRY